MSVTVDARLTCQAGDFFIAFGIVSVSFGFVIGLCLHSVGAFDVGNLRNVTNRA